MFIVSKLIQTVLQPSNILGLMVIFASLCIALNRVRIGRASIFLSAAGIILFGWSPLGPYALAKLEDRFPIPGLPASVSGIVMLGGAVNTHLTADRNSIVVNDNAERMFAVAALARRYPDARILLSGGAAEFIKGVPLTESEGARRLLVDLGIPNDRLELEERSRTTFENAVESLKVAQPNAGETWLLVTSAYNMPRAVASFRAVGFSVVPYPVDFRTRPADLRRPVSSLTGGLAFADAAAHEWLGLIGYRLTGRTGELLPRPGG